MNSESDELKALINAIDQYSKGLKEEPAGRLSVEPLTTGRKTRDVCILRGNKAALAGVAARILHTLTTDEGWYRIDNTTGILDDETKEFVITLDAPKKAGQLERY